MKRTEAIKLYRQILNVMQEAEHIEEDFKEFLIKCMDDYVYDNKKLGYSLESLFEFKRHLVKSNLNLEVKEE
jgi:DNA-binding transcriptional regulator YhcF (GntR family)